MQAMETAEFAAHFQHRFPNCVGRPLLVALSGGRDSVALIHLLRDPSLDLRLSAVHVHHGLRGGEADADAEFCRRLCGALAVPFEVVHLPDDDQRPATGEAAWRRRRYRALFRHAAEHGIDTIATAHHRDDVAEGVLVQILRGAGPRALAGIAAKTADGVIRPLLPWGRREIDGWLQRHDIAWRDDTTNLDTDRLRNRVRHEVLPELERGDPQLRTHLVNLAAAIADAEDFLAAELDRRAAFIDPWDPDGGVATELVAELPRALRTRWLHGQMLRLGVDRVTRRQLELFHLCLDRGTPRSVTMGRRWRLRTARGRLWAEPPTDPPGAETILEPGATATMGPPGWLVRMSTGKDADPDVRWRWRPRSDDTLIRFRPARPDDRLVVASGATRRAQKLLAERLPRHLRSAWPLFCENDMICWIPGVWQHPDPGESSNRVVEVIRQ